MILVLLACSRLPVPPPADLIPGLWVAPDGASIDLWFEERAIPGTGTKVCEGKFEAVDLLGPGSSGVQVWNYGGWGPIVLNLVDAGSSYHALTFEEVDPTHARMRATTDPNLANQAAFLDDPATRVFERQEARARTITGQCPRPRPHG